MTFTPRAQALIDALYAGRDHVELTVGILKDGQIETVHYDENRNISGEKLIYPVGSIGKPFTASLLAKQIDAGKISLDDRLNRFIPNLPDMPYPTIRRLATHHSGYGGAPHTFLQTLSKFLHMNDEDGILHVNPFRGFPDEQVMLEVLKTKKLKDQDYKFAYSNFAFGVLGYILGKLDGTDYYGTMEAYLRELGLNDTSLANSTMTGYDKKGNPCKPWQWERTDIVAPAGALLSSMEDLLKFARMNLDGSLPYLALCHEKYAPGEKSFDQGLAWRLKKDSAISYHVGNAGAFSCILAIDREKQQAAVIGLNHALVDIEQAAFSLLE